MRVDVIRGAGDRVGPDISDSLLTTEVAAIERGRVEIERNSTPRDLVSLSLPLGNWIAPGVLVAVEDRDGKNWRGMVIGCSLSVSRDQGSVTAETRLEIEREALL
jgi:hypothetical protein